MSSLQSLARDFRVECAAAAQDEGLSVGVGRPKHGVPGVREGFREAEQALVMGDRVFGPGRVHSFADLGLYRLLFAMAGQPELREFHDDVLGGLVEYDKGTKGDLVRTLDAFFACHGSPTDMAERLHLHRNTVLYRLRRIEEVGKLDLDDPAVRLNLHLSLRAGEVLQGVDRTH